MARKKTEVALQLEIETQEEWEELLTKEGLIVVDVYQEWCGPCKAMLSNLRRHRNDLGDDLLKFAVAKADTIDSLERYRGKCEPCFLFYAGGSLVAVVRGANAPNLSKTLINELMKERKVLNGEAERAEIRDPMFAHLESQEKSTVDEEENEKDEDDLVPKEVTVALLKPDIVKEGKAEEVLHRMKAAGIEILKNEVRQLTEDEARNFYSHLSSEPFFDDLIQFMCSGPSHVLLLSKPSSPDGKGIIKEWRELIGPTKVEEAKEKQPDSLRALYGTREMFNAIHGSDSQSAAARELAFFFPTFKVPMMSKKHSSQTGSTVSKSIQRTLALIRPEALLEKKDAIIQRIREAGFTIALEKEIQLTREQAMEFYKEHTEQPYFDELVDKMTSGPILALGLAREDAIHEWRKMLGPTTQTEAKVAAPESLRAQFAIGDSEVNMIHGSDTEEHAQKEINYFFPMQQTVAVVKPDAYKNRDAIMDKIKEAGFHIAARKETTLTKDIAAMMYSGCADKEFYNDLIEHMSSGPTLFMVLSKEDAVQNWRGVIGPTDPNVAKESAPQSIRAQFGTDVKANAVHGPSTAKDAKAVMEEILGELVFDAEGAIVQGGSDIKEGVEILDGSGIITKESQKRIEKPSKGAGESADEQEEQPAPEPQQSEAVASEPAQSDAAAELIEERAPEPLSEVDQSDQNAKDEAPEVIGGPAMEDSPASDSAPAADSVQPEGDTTAVVSEPEQERTAEIKPNTGAIAHASAPATAVAAESAPATAVVAESAPATAGASTTESPPASHEVPAAKDQIPEETPQTQ